MNKLKPFRFEGEEFAAIYHQCDEEGNFDPKSASIEFDSPWYGMNPKQARRFAEWLVKAADFIESKNKKGQFGRE